MREGPTDIVALLRIGIALLVWTRWGSQLAYFWRPHPEMWALGSVFFVASTAMLVGFWSRTSTAITAATLFVGWLHFVPAHGMSDEFEHHHTRILMAANLFLAFTPCGGSWSLDRWLAVRRAEADGQPSPRNWGSLWATDLIALQVSTVYFWSAWDKSQWAFLSGERLENMFVKWYFFDYPYWLPGFHEACVAMAWFTVLLEYVLPFVLFVPKLQRWFVPAGLLLHGVFFVVLPVGTFTCTMMLLYLAYLRPEQVRGVLSRVSDL
jgi:uncharacterized membrane protein YphA (DoxX/SURF4 family)